MQKKIILILALLSAAYFIIFCFPNSANSRDISLVEVFEPDEAMPLPYVFHMIQPYGTLKETLYNFAYYDYYFYGFPYFALSAALLLPLKWAGQLTSIPLVMTVLRQGVSLLPMLAAIWLLVYMQTGFKNWKAAALFLLLTAMPAVVESNLWWHPDGLAILLMMLAVFFLVRDDLRFGSGFFLSAALCGIAAMTKGIGFYFFLAFLVYLIIGWASKRASIGRLALSALGCLGVMAAAYFISNPILFYGAERERFFAVMREQSQLLTQGYELQYSKGFQAAWPILTEYYGGWALLLPSLAACIWGILRGPNRLMQTIILAWVIPLSVLDFAVIHFKFQYWLPAALPLFSTLVLALPERIDFQNLRSGAGRRNLLDSLARVAVGAVLMIQWVLFISAGVQRIDVQLHKSEGSPAMAFYDEMILSLAPLPQDTYRVYHDVRMYVPEKTGWKRTSSFEMLTYEYISQGRFDILLLRQRRVNDYLNEKAQAVNAEKIARAREFYGDVRSGTVDGYRMIYQDDYGLIFVSDALFDGYFSAAKGWPACSGCQP